MFVVADGEFGSVFVFAWGSRSRATVAGVIVRASKLRVMGVRRMHKGVRA